MTYQLKTFARRNKALVGGVLGVFLALLAGLIVSMSLYFQVAWESETTRAVNDFYNEMLASIDPMQINIISGFRVGDGAAPLPPRTSEHDVSVEEMMDHAAERVAEAFKGRPGIEAEVRMRIGFTYNSMGLRRKAWSQLEAALQIRREYLGDDHPDTLCSRVQLAFVSHGSGPKSLPEAISDAGAAYEGMKRVFGDDHPHTLTSASVLATLQTRSGNVKEADPLLRRTVEAQERLLGKEDRNTLWTRCRWAYHLALNGRLREAHEQIQVVIDIVDRPGSVYDKNDYITIFSKMVLGGYCVLMGEYTRAEEGLRPAIDRCGRILGEGSWFRFGGMWCLAQSLKGESTLQEREQLLRETLDGFRSSVGYGDPWTIRTVDELCNLLAFQGRYDEVVATCQAAWDACRQEKGLPDSYRPAWLQHLANALLNGGRFDEGEQKYREWLDVISENYGEEHPETLNALAFVGKLFFHAGKVKEVRELVERAIKARRRIASAGEASVSDLTDFAMYSGLGKLDR